MERKQKAATESAILLAIIAAIFVALNVVSYLGVYARVDATENERYKLSDGSKKLVRSLKKGTLTVEAYVTRGLPQLDAFVRDLRDLLQEYKTAAPDTFTFKIIEATTEEEKKAAEEAGLEKIEFGEANATDQAKGAVASGYMGLVFKYGSEKKNLPAVAPGQEGVEFWISNKIREVRDIVEDRKTKVGTMSGHDEIKISEPNLVAGQQASVEAIVKQNFPFYDFSEVDLHNGDTAVPDDLAGLIITQPNKDWTEKELRRIDEFVLKGKSVVILAGAVNIKSGDATMNATLSTHGLEKLTEGYGIEMHKDAVLDYKAPFGGMIPIPQMGTAVNLPPNPSVLLLGDDARYSGNTRLIDDSFNGFFRLKQVVVPLASSLTVLDEKQPEAKSQVVFRSSPGAISVTTENVNLKPIPPDHFMTMRGEGKVEQKVIGVAREGVFKTAFPTGDKMGVDVPEKGVGPSRLLVVASSHFLANPYARAGKGPDMPQMPGMPPMGNMGDRQLQQYGQIYLSVLVPTIVAFKNTLDWMNGDTELLAASAKILSEPSLKYGELPIPEIGDNESMAAAQSKVKQHADDTQNARKKVQRSVEFWLILGIPFLIALFGVFRWRMRVSSRSNVSLA